MKPFVWISIFQPICWIEVIELKVKFFFVQGFMLYLASYECNILCKCTETFVSPATVCTFSRKVFSFESTDHIENPLPNISHKLYNV